MLFATRASIRLIVVVLVVVVVLFSSSSSSNSSNKVYKWKVCSQMLTMSIFERESEKEIPTCVMIIILPCTSRLSHSIFKGVNDGPVVFTDGVCCTKVERWKHLKM